MGCCPQVEERDPNRRRLIARFDGLIDAQGQIVDWDVNQGFNESVRFGCEKCHRPIGCRAQADFRYAEGIANRSKLLCD